MKAICSDVCLALPVCRAHPVQCVLLLHLQQGSSSILVQELCQSSHCPRKRCLLVCRQIQKDFGFTDQQKDALLGGWIAAAFFLVGAPSALLMGALTQSHNRRNLLFIIVLLGGF